MDEFEGICPACRRVWNLRTMLGSESVNGNSFIMHCPCCQITAPSPMKQVVMKRVETRQPKYDIVIVDTERIS